MQKTLNNAKGDAIMFEDFVKSIDNVIMDSHQDMLVNFLSVHDETVQIVNKKLAKGIMKKVSDISELSSIFSKVGVPFINFKFDVEFDEWGSYTASDSFNLDEFDLERCIKLNNFEEELKELRKFGTQPEQKETPEKPPESDKFIQHPIKDKEAEEVSLREEGEPTITVEFEEDEISHNLEFFNSLDNLEDGETRLVIVVKGEYFMQDRAYDLEQLEDALELIK